MKLSLAEARALAVNAQGLGKARPKGRVGLQHVRSTVNSLGLLQLDAINVVARTQNLVLFSRIGAFAERHLHQLTGPGGELFEYWGHACSLQPVAMHPLFRWRMEHGGTYGGRPAHAAWIARFEKENAHYIEAVLGEIRERGALAASQLSDPRRRDGEWWDRRSLGRVTLEYLYSLGRLAGWRTPSFERVYDLPERVIPAEVLALPTPTIEDAHRALIMQSARALGVATVRDLAEYYYLKATVVKVHVAELVDAGRLTKVAVEGWRDPACVVPGSMNAKVRRDHASLLSPFDSLISNRNRIQRLFGFDYMIEVYTPEPKRKYGYYVLPLLLGDQLVGRFDLKADRAASTLRVRGSYAEPGVDAKAIAGPAAAELHRLREWLALDAVDVENRGNAARPIRAAAQT